MLTKLWANNYRCFVNFEVEFDSLTLLLGPNGGGKTSIFDILYNLRKLIIDNAKVYEVFSPDDLTAWLDSNEQTFELQVEGNGGIYTYRLVISHQRELGKLRIEQETLHYDNKVIFSFEKGDIHLYNDYYKEGAIISFDWMLSGLSMVVSRQDNTKLTWFKDWINKLFILNLEPKAIHSVSEDESSQLFRDGKNFVSWYRYFSQEHQDKMYDLITYLRNSLYGFDSLKLELAGKHRILQVGFRGEKKGDKTLFFDFDRLSDGQKVLFILHTLLVYLQEMGNTLMMDEPENYIALAEIQPWLMELSDVCGVKIPQIIIISHHPELIDYFGVEKSRLIVREPLGPARVKQIFNRFEDSLKLSELIARGWENE